jgi:hypothetical protein
VGFFLEVAKSLSTIDRTTPPGEVV